VPPNALTDAERAQVLAVLTSDRFVDKSVAQAWATLLDEGTYLCSMSTMHRILRAHDAAGERRAQAAHPARTKPELVATRAGQVWSWDITKLRGPQRGVYYDLYVVLDIFSRFVVAWTIAAREDSEIAKEMLAHAMGVHGIPEAIHSDSKYARCQVFPGTVVSEVFSQHPDPHSDRPVGVIPSDMSVAREHLWRGPRSRRCHVTREGPDGLRLFTVLSRCLVRPRATHCCHDRR
jgi:hypothetical protein